MMEVKMDMITRETCFRCTSMYVCTAYINNGVRAGAYYFETDYKETYIDLRKI